MYIHSFQWTWKNNLTIKKLLGPLLHRNNSCLVETSGRYPWLRLVPFWQCILTWFLLDSGNHLALRYQGFFGRCYNADERHCLSVLQCRYVFHGVGVTKQCLDSVVIYVKEWRKKQVLLNTPTFTHAVGQYGQRIEILNKQH